MNEQQLLNRLHIFVKKHYNNSESAKALGISQPYFSLIRSGKRPIPDKIALLLGFKPIKCYVKL